MKIVLVIDHLKNGGAERVVSVLSNELIKMGHETHVIVTIDENNYALNKEVKYHVAEGMTNNKLIRRATREYSLKKCINRINPDVIYSFGYYMNLYSIFACGDKYKLIISERNDPERELNNSVLRAIRNMLYGKCSLMVCQTPQARDYYKKRINRPIVVIPNPISDALPDPWFGEREKKIVTACRLEPQKNLPMLIDAFKVIHEEYSDYKLIIYGDGSLKEELYSKILKLGLEEYIRLPGFEKNIHEKILKSAMYVSSSDYEGISNSMLEALAIGLPTICTDCPVGGAAMAIDDGINGVLVPVGNVNELYKAMKKVLDDKRFADSISKNAICVRQKYNANKIAVEWVKLIDY